MDPHDQEFKLGLLACLDQALAAARHRRDRCRRRLVMAVGQPDDVLCARAAEFVDADRLVRYRAALVHLVSACVFEHDAAECIRRMPSLVNAAYRAAQ